MSKKDELLHFLENRLFEPILSSPIASDELKYDFSSMKSTINQFSTEGILRYFWTTMTNDEVQMVFTDRLEDEAFIDFTAFLNDFKSYFTYDWLRS